jgi:hypothetical protein
MSAEVDAPTLKKWLSDGSEIALIDVREAGQVWNGHPFFAVRHPHDHAGSSAFGIAAAACGSSEPALISFAYQWKEAFGMRRCVG